MAVLQDMNKYFADFSQQERLRNVSLNRGTYIKTGM
jgi:hypothetical protein